MGILAALKTLGFLLLCSLAAGTGGFRTDPCTTACKLFTALLLKSDIIRPGPVGTGETEAAHRMM